jgi:hypothetical protein
MRQAAVPRSSRFFYDPAPKSSKKMRNLLIAGPESETLLECARPPLAMATHRSGYGGLRLEGRAAEEERKQE